MSRTELVIIDPQNDFCDSSGALYVKDAEHDMVRLASFVNKFARKLDAINVTLDSHHLVDIAHPIYWVNSAGKNPDPFTIILAKDVEEGVWTPARPSLMKKTLEYVKQLESSGRYALCIWPPHCLIGSWGNNVFPVLFDTLKAWEQDIRVVNYVTKGSNIFTEHYSAVKAEVPDPADTTTQINSALIQQLMDADTILFAGEAGSHCLANTITDIANEFGDDSYVKKIVLLEDATHPVTGFESLQDDFIKEMTGRGMRISTTTDFVA